jgi:hypothetical protein
VEVTSPHPRAAVLPSTVRLAILHPSSDPKQPWEPRILSQWLVALRFLSHFHPFFTSHYLAKASVRSS